MFMDIDYRLYLCFIPLIINLAFLFYSPDEAQETARAIVIQLGGLILLPFIVGIAGRMSRAVWNANAYIVLGLEIICACVMLGFMIVSFRRKKRRASMAFFIGAFSLIIWGVYLFNSYQKAIQV